MSIELVGAKIHSNSEWVNRTIRETGLREHFQALVVGIEREGKRMLNPDSTVSIRSGDLLWIVGNPNLLASSPGLEIQMR
jgi:monovalent cation:H+ antiporter-2, CPA2 family